jgi:hypothetical protein
MQAIDASRRMLRYLNTTAKPIGVRSVVRRRNRDSLLEIIAGHPGTVATATPAPLAWAAGLFDGDGSFTSSRSRSNPYPVLTASIGQSGADGIPHVLTQFKEVVGCGRINGPYKDANPNALPQYAWICTVHDEVRELFSALARYLSPHKHRQWQYVLEKYERDLQFARDLRLRR